MKLESRKQVLNCTNEWNLKRKGKWGVIKWRKRDCFLLLDNENLGFIVMKASKLLNFCYYRDTISSKWVYCKTISRLDCVTCKCTPVTIHRPVSPLVRPTNKHAADSLVTCVIHMHPRPAEDTHTLTLLCHRHVTTPSGRACPHVFSSHPARLRGRNVISNHWCASLTRSLRHVVKRQAVSFVASAFIGASWSGKVSHRC